MPLDVSDSEKPWFVVVHANGEDKGRVVVEVMESKHLGLQRRAMVFIDRTKAVAQAAFLNSVYAPRTFAVEQTA